VAIAEPQSVTSLFKHTIFHHDILLTEEGFVSAEGEGYLQGGFKGPTPGVASVAQAKTQRDDSWGCWRAILSDRLTTNCMGLKTPPARSMSILTISAR